MSEVLRRDGLGGTEVWLALRSEVQRYGVERIVRSLNTVTALDIHDIAPAEMPAPQTDKTRVVVIAVREIDESVTPLLEVATGSCAAKVLCLVDASDPTELTRAARIGADGFLDVHELNTEALGEALDRIRRGEVPLPPGMARELLARARDEEEPTSVKAINMTPREQQAVALLVEGLSNKEIARRMKISEHGAKRLVANILAKLHSPNRTVAVVKVLQDEALYEALCMPPR